MEPTTVLVPDRQPPWGNALAKKYNPMRGEALPRGHTRILDNHICVTKLKK